MRLDVTPAVGNAAARAVHGHSAGADVVILGSTPGSAAAATDLAQSLAEVVPGLRRHDLDGHQPSRRWQPWPRPTTTAPWLPWLPTSRCLPSRCSTSDRPGDPTATATVEPGGAGSAGPSVTTATGLPLLRTHPERRDVLSVGTARHTVTNPTALGAGLLRVAARDRLRPPRSGAPRPAPPARSILRSLRLTSPCSPS